MIDIKNRLNKKSHSQSSCTNEPWFTPNSRNVEKHQFSLKRRLEMLIKCHGDPELEDF